MIFIGNKICDFNRNIDCDIISLMKGADMGTINTSEDRLADSLNLEHYLINHIIMENKVFRLSISRGW